MELVILVSFVLFFPMFSSELVETSHVDNIYNEGNEVVTNGGRIDLEMDYAMPHPRPPTPSDPPRAQHSYSTKCEVDEVVTKGREMISKTLDIRLNQCNNS